MITHSTYNTASLWRATITMLVVLCLQAGCTKTTTQVPNILINNLGYLPHEAKIGFVTDPFAITFSVINVETGEIELQSPIISEPTYAAQAGDLVKTIDFSGFNKAGSYKIQLDTDEGSSYEFKIGQEIYTDALSKVLKSFYLQRCGVEVLSEYGSHKACHLNLAHYYHNEVPHEDVSGGWHDAGDYNRFAVTHSYSIALLIHQYLEAPQKYVDGHFSIPESSNGIPDILDEIQVGLRWLLKIQNANGGVHHKVSIKEWNGEHLPDQDSTRQYIFHISSTATAGAAGVFALGSGVFSDIDPTFSSKLNRAALKAWDFLDQNPVTVPLGGFTNPPDVFGGEYGDQIDLDERLFAAIELFKMTGDTEFLDFFQVNYNKFWNRSFYVPSWQDLRNFAFYSYLKLDQTTPGLDFDVYNDLLSLSKDYAESILNRTNANPYKYSLNNNEYYWGSNSIALGYAFDLIQAFKIHGNRQYREAAKDHLHYMFGRNPIGISFVTGIGSNPVKDPYHQFSALTLHPNPIPGMLVGGANYSTHLNNKPISEFQAKNYEDRFRNYMVNEPAINYTATLSYVLGYFSHPPATKEHTL